MSYRSESNTTAWFVGIIATLALLAIAYLVFSANLQPSTGPKKTFTVLTDEDTGCQYIATTGYHFEPRMGADGKQVCAPL